MNKVFEEILFIYQLRINILITNQRQEVSKNEQKNYRNINLYATNDYNYKYSSKKQHRK